MRRIVIAIGTTLTGLVLLFSYSTSLHRGGAIAGTLGAGGTAPAPGAAPAAAAGAAPASATTTYDGDASSTPYGPVQVRITVSGSKITAADAIQLPSGNGYDEQVRQYAVPVLIQETVAAQSAKIAMVSGATYTSDGYMRSLQSAIDQAHL